MAYQTQLPPAESTLALIKPDAVAAGNAQDILQLTLKAGFTISAKRICQLTPERAEEFYGEHQGKSFFPTLVNFMTSGPLCTLKLTKPGAIKAWRELIGPTNSSVAREQKPESLRALYGSDGTKNACHGSANPEDAARELEFFFPPARNAAAEASAARYQGQVRDRLMPTLTYGMVALAQQAQRGGRLPDNCVAWLGNWLLSNDPNKATGQQVQPALAEAAAAAPAGGESSGAEPKSALVALAFAPADQEVDLSGLSFPFGDDDAAAEEDETPASDATVPDTARSQADVAAVDDADEADGEEPEEQEEGLGIEPSAPDVSEGKLANEPSDYTYATVTEEDQAADQDLGELELAEPVEESANDVPLTPSKQVLFVEGHNVKLLDNPGDLAEESTGNEDDLGLVPMTRLSSGFKRQSTFFERFVKPVDEDEQDDVDDADVGLDEAAAAAAGEDVKEAAAAPIGEASEYETDYTEGATEYTEEEVEEGTEEPQEAA